MVGIIGKVEAIVYTIDLLSVLLESLTYNVGGAFFFQCKVYYTT